jgi:cell division protein FtsN
MVSYNIRRPSLDTYDPKQRVVGGFVLFLLMLLLYSILKLVLGISSAGEHIVLPERRPDEIAAEAEFANNQGQQPATATTATATHNTRPTATQSRRSLPQGFVFLDINGNPINEERTLPEETVATNNSSNEGDTSGWVVQVASFREEERAEALVEKLKTKGMVPTIVKSGAWYVIKLPVQEGRDAADQQLKQLRSLGIRGMVKPAD